MVSQLCLVTEAGHPPVTEVEGMQTGNLCRCTGYVAIRAAIRDLVGE